MSEPDHIIDGLYIGPIEAVAEHSGNFGLIVSVCQDCRSENVPFDVPYEHYPLADDRESQRNWGGSIAYSMFMAAAESVTDALQADEIENVLVHCHRGKNRSAAVCAAAIGVHTGRTFDHALAYIEDARPVVDPNDLMRAHGRRFVDMNRSALGE